jgi:hypothetical protein
MRVKEFKQAFDSIHPDIPSEYANRSFRTKSGKVYCVNSDQIPYVNSEDDLIYGSSGPWRRKPIVRWFKVKNIELA